MKEVEISDVTADSRKAGKGVLFVAVKGEHYDGNDFIFDAVCRGAEAVVTEADVCEKTSAQIFIVDDAKSALARLCARIYARKANSKVIAVTGTNGKTTTAMLVASIFSAAGCKTAIIGTLGAGVYGDELRPVEGMTTPIPEKLYRIIGELSEAEYLILEASSQGVEEKRLDGLADTDCTMKAAVFTNLSAEHLDYHRDMESYFRSKMRLFTDFGFERSIINVDDGYGKRVAAIAKCAVTVGCGAEYESGEISRTADGVEYVISSPRLSLEVKCPFAGAYTVENTLLAAAVALSEGMNPTNVVTAIGAFCGLRGRMEKLDTGGFCADVFVDFAHTPEAVKALLTSAKVSFPNRKIKLLFGCGGDRDRSKRAVMGRIATELADFTVITSDNSRSERPQDIISDILKGVDANSSYCVIPDRKNAIEYILKNAEAGDVILLAGKGHEDYDCRNGMKTHFDEREIVREVTDKINGS